MAVYGVDYTGHGDPSDPYIPLTCEGFIFCIDCIAYTNTTTGQLITPSSTQGESDISVKITQDINFTLSETYRNGLPNGIGLRVRCNHLYSDEEDPTKIPKINGIKNVLNLTNTNNQASSVFFFSALGSQEGTYNRSININIENMNFSNCIFDDGIRNDTNFGSFIRVSNSSTSLEKIESIKFSNCIITILLNTGSHVPHLCNDASTKNNNIVFEYCSLFMQNAHTSNVGSSNTENPPYKCKFLNCSIQLENFAIVASSNYNVIISNLSYCLLFGNVYTINKDNYLISLTNCSHSIIALTNRNLSSEVKISSNDCSNCAIQDDNSITGNMPVSQTYYTGITGLTKSNIKKETELINAGVIP